MASVASTLLACIHRYPLSKSPQITIQSSRLRSKRRLSFQLSPYKRTIALFLAEVLYHVLRHPMPDEPMYEFIRLSVQALDQSEEPQNFHLAFLVGLAAKLGFEMEEELPLPHSRKERQEALQTLCNYFEEHVETWQTPRSLDVLMEVFD